jgi:hypothetical protein
MNLGQHAVEAVKARARTARAPFVLEEVGDGIHLTLEIQDSDKYGALVRQLSARRDAGRRQSLTRLLREQAAEIERRLTYLLEDFRLIELDETAGTAQIRSGTPYRDTDALHYYEILLAGGNTLTCTRYQKTGKNGGREIEPCYFTEQMLARVCDDIAAVLRLGA